MRYDTLLNRQELDDLRFKCERVVIGKDFMPNPKEILRLIAEVEACWDEVRDMQVELDASHNERCELEEEIQALEERLEAR